LVFVTNMELWEPTKLEGALSIAATWSCLLSVGKAVHNIPAGAKLAQPPVGEGVNPSNSSRAGICSVSPGTLQTPAGCHPLAACGIALRMHDLKSSVPRPSLPGHEWHDELAAVVGTEQDFIGDLKETKERQKARCDSCK
jgi:hypothetical protein